MDIEKIARCLICNEEFTEEDLKNVLCCPKCGNKGIPANPKEDVTIKINWHELRVLTIWAEHWANQIDKECPKSALTVACIARRVQKQYPDKTPLTLAGEIEDLKKNFPDFKITETNIPDKPNKIAGEFNV